MKTAIIYSRVSTKEQANENQVKQMTDYCNRNGYEINGVFEEKVSGAATEKEILDSIINDEPKADCIVIREISRLSRETDYIEALAKVNKLVKKYTIVIVADNYVIEKGNVLPVNDGLLLIVKLYGAKDEREKIAMRVTEARRRYAQNPINFAYGGIPFGLEKVPNPDYQKGFNTKCILQPGDNWDTVVQVYTLTAAGLSHAQVARNVGISQTLVYDILRNKKLKMFLPEGLAESAKEASRKNASVASPSKHDNIYKGIIFDGDTDKPMHHQCATQGNRYIVAGKGSISDEDLNETVQKALTSFVAFFNVAKDDVVRERNERIRQIGLAIDTNVNLLHNKKANLELTRTKALNTKDLELFERLNKEIRQQEKDITDLTKQMNKWHKEIKRLKSLDIRNEEITLENLETYVNRYVKAVRYYPVKQFVRRIRVEIKDEYLPEGANNFKEYEVCRKNNEHYIKPLDLIYANEMLKETGINVEDTNDYWNVNPSVYYGND